MTGADSVSRGTTSRDDQIRKVLLVLLSATQPGEIAAARDTLVKLMGGDVHTVADRLLRSTGTVLEWIEPPSADCSHQEMAQDIIDISALHGVRLSPTEESFVFDMQDWKYPTSKQMSWLKRIHARVVLGRY